MNINNNLKQKLKRLGKHIKTLRQKQNITISTISAKTGINKNYLYKIERGKAYRVTIDKHLMPIADSLNVTILDIISFE